MPYRSKHVRTTDSGVPLLEPLCGVPNCPNPPDGDGHGICQKHIDEWQQDGVPGRDTDPYEYFGIGMFGVTLWYWKEKGKPMSGTYPRHIMLPKSIVEIFKGAGRWEDVEDLNVLVIAVDLEHSTAKLRNHFVIDKDGRYCDKVRMNDAV